MRSEMKACMAATLLVIALGNGVKTVPTADAQGAAPLDLGTIAVIDVPGAANNSPLDINAEGVIVGRYASGGRTHGFVRTTAGEFTPIDVPGSVFTSATSINERGDIVGQFALSSCWFWATTDLRFAPSGGQPVSLDKGSINERGDVVGAYCSGAVPCLTTLTAPQHGFVIRDGVFTPFDVPGARATAATGINTRGDIVGTYSDGTRFHGFLIGAGGARNH